MNLKNELLGVTGYASHSFDPSQRSGDAFCLLMIPAITKWVLTVRLLWGDRGHPWGLTGQHSL